MSRYHRQILLPQIGQAGQRRIGESRVLLIGCGALGSVLAEQLARAGVGWLRIADRDVVELTNLQRQVLYAENDARESRPKAIAAAERLRSINSAITIEPAAVDVHAGNIEELAGLAGDGGAVDLILDGTDNVQIRYLINDVAVKHGRPWVYGGCVGMEGRAMAIRPPGTACLRCIFPQPPDPSELPTCDTAGVLAAAAAMAASLQGVMAIKILSGNDEALAAELVSFDAWTNRFHALPIADAKRVDCICCGRRKFEFLADDKEDSAVRLCGRNAVQVRPIGRIIDLKTAADRLAGVGEVSMNPYFVRCKLYNPMEIELTFFPDGRLLVQGTNDPGRAKAIYTRFIGS